MKASVRILVTLLFLVVARDAYCENVENSRLEMDPSTEVILGGDVLKFVTKPAYPRICLMEGGEYLLAWQETIPGRSDDNGRYISYAISSDLKTWTPMGHLFENKMVANPPSAFTAARNSCSFQTEI